MAYSYIVEEALPDDILSMKRDIHRAKTFLQKHSTKSGDSLYDHLIELLTKILAEQPQNVVDTFEEYSRKLKEERFKIETDHLRNLYISPMQYNDAKKLIKLFQVQFDNIDNEITIYSKLFQIKNMQIVTNKSVKQIDEDEQERIKDEEENDKKKKYPNMLDLLFYFEQTGVGLLRHEIMLLNLSIRKLALTMPLENLRFWGKILGKPKNYYILEAELKADELVRRLEQEQHEVQSKKEKEEIKAKTETKFLKEKAEKKKKEAMEEIVEITKSLRKNKKLEGKPLERELIFPSLPVNSWKSLPEIPIERIGSGLNKKVYFVCNAPGLDEWIELPMVTPQQIVIARQIVRYCTGNLETPIHSFPPFPGNEKNYLRAQIARISATTHVSPIGFFILSGEDEEETEEERKEIYMKEELLENINYDPLPIKDLVDPSMSNWCHHSPYILKQGRTVWWNYEKKENIIDEIYNEEEEEDIEKDEVKVMEKEIGQPLLIPLSEDAIVDSVIPWTARQSSYIQSDIAVALVRSNIWPGAFAFAVGKCFATVYIGWGHKYNAYNYNPSDMPPVQDQYKIGPEIMEICDPTVKEEEAYQLMHLPTLPIEEEGILEDKEEKKEKEEEEVEEEEANDNEEDDE